MKLSARKNGYIPTLDGWRTLAVFAVIAYHDRSFRIGSFNDDLIHRFGFLGVDLFFAISGLLICSRLLEEEKICKRINIRSFYIRRFCRILPPATIYLLVVAILSAFHQIQNSAKAWLAAMFFYRNYYSALTGNDSVSPYTNHFWSLSIEEHFYLFLPIFLITFPKIRVKLLAFLIVLSLTYSQIVHSIPHLTARLGGEFADRRTELHLTGLLFGSLLAILFANPHVQSFGRKWITPLSSFLVFGIVWVIGHHLEEGFGARMIVPLGFPFIILSTILHPQSILGRCLELRPMRFLGRISYSIYLWQQLFFVGDHSTAAAPLCYLQSRPINLVATLILAIASYFLIEKRFIRFGHRLAPPATLGR